MKRVCPNCGSENVEADTREAGLTINSGGWLCRECGYSGTMPEE